MASLFEGTPQTASSTSTSATQTPKWLQDAIYQQLSAASGVAQTPYSPYGGQLVAGSTPQQTQAWQQVSNLQGQYQPWLTQAQQQTSQLASSPGAAAAAQPLLSQAAKMSGLSAAQPYLNQQASALAGVDTGAAARGLIPYVQSSLQNSGLAAAQPYMQAAGQTSVSNVGDYMNPYTQNVTDQIAKLGARNLSENLLPAVSDSFIRAGQFGGTRMGEFGSRALRDTQESVLNQQAQALQSGYGQALGASQSDLTRQLQLAGQAGSLGSAQQQAVLSGGQALSSAQQQASAQEMARAQALGALGSQFGNLTQAQQAQLASIGAQQGQLAGTDLSRQQSALQQLATLAQQGQTMGLQGTQALEAAGTAQRGIAQQGLDSAYQQYQNELAYPKTQLSWLQQQLSGAAPLVDKSTVQTGTSTGQTYSASPLSQLAAAVAAGAGLYKLTE